MTWENPADDIHKWLDAYASQRMRAEGWEVDRLLVEAMALQDLGMLGRLFVVRQDGCAPGVASIWRG